MVNQGLRFSLIVGGFGKVQSGYKFKSWQMALGLAGAALFAGCTGDSRPTSWEYTFNLRVGIFNCEPLCNKVWRSYHE